MSTNMEDPVQAGALDHLRVLDLTHWIAGPYCTKLMAGFGAEVIKIERPGSGDPIRSRGPFAGNRPRIEKSIQFLWFNTGKKSLTLNLKTDAGKAIFKSLVEKADVVVENFSPRVMPSLGLDYKTLRALNPGIVMTSISNFGQTGPYREYRADEITAYAMSGLMYATGDPTRAPLKAGPAICQLTAGLNAYTATLMACYRRAITGQGDLVDVSIHEAALDNLEIGIAEYLHLGKVPKRSNDEHALVPWQLYPCQDGYAAIIGGPIRHWWKAADLFEEPRLLEKTHAHMADRIKNRAEIRKRISPWLSRKNRLEIFHSGQARRLAFGYLATLEDVFASPQNQARGFFVEVNDPEIGTYQLPGVPFRPAQTGWRMFRAPRLGEHSEDVLRSALGMSSEQIGRLRFQGVV